MRWAIVCCTHIVFLLSNLRLPYHHFDACSGQVPLHTFPALLDSEDLSCVQRTSRISRWRRFRLRQHLRCLASRGRLVFLLSKEGHFDVVLTGGTVSRRSTARLVCLSCTYLLDRIAGRVIPTCVMLPAVGVIQVCFVCKVTVEYPTAR